MARKDEILFEAFESLAGELGGFVSRGGIFTAHHPRLKTRIHDRDAVLFFQKERRDLYLCIRISHTFPILVVIKPRYRTFGIFRLDLSLNAESIEPSIPHLFLDHFIIKTDNEAQCLKFISSDAFAAHFQELLSPGILEEKFFEEFRPKEAVHNECAEEPARMIDFANIDRELEKLTVPKRECFFYPYIILDQKGAFLKVRFSHFHEMDADRKKGVKSDASRESADSHKNELRKVLHSYLSSLLGLLQVGF